MKIKAIDAAKKEERQINTSWDVSYVKEANVAFVYKSGQKDAFIVDLDTNEVEKIPAREAPTA